MKNKTVFCLWVLSSPVLLMNWNGKWTLAYRINEAYATQNTLPAVFFFCFQYSHVWVFVVSRFQSANYFWLSACRNFFFLLALKPDAWRSSVRLYKQWTYLCTVTLKTSWQIPFPVRNKYTLFQNLIQPNRANNYIS